MAELPTCKENRKQRADELALEIAIAITDTLVSKIVSSCRLGGLYLMFQSVSALQNADLSILASTTVLNMSVLSYWCVSKSLIMSTSRCVSPSDESLLSFLLGRVSQKNCSKTPIDVRIFH